MATADILATYKYPQTPKTHHNSLKLTTTHQNLNYNNFIPISYKQRIVVYSIITSKHSRKLRNSSPDPVIYNMSAIFLLKDKVVLEQSYINLPTIQSLNQSAAWYIINRYIVSPKVIGLISNDFLQGGNYIAESQGLCHPVSQSDWPPLAIRAFASGWNLTLTPIVEQPYF